MTRNKDETCSCVKKVSDESDKDIYYHQKLPAIAVLSQYGSCQVHHHVVVQNGVAPFSLLGADLVAIFAIASILKRLSLCIFEHSLDMAVT